MIVCVDDTLMKKCIHVVFLDLGSLKTKVLTTKLLSSCHINHAYLIQKKQFPKGKRLNVAHEYVDDEGENLPLCHLGLALFSQLKDLSLRSFA